jgi:hypothetical protein
VTADARWRTQDVLVKFRQMFQNSVGSVSKKQISVIQDWHTHVPNKFLWTHFLMVHYNLCLIHFSLALEETCPDNMCVLYGLNNIK